MARLFFAEVHELSCQAGWARDELFPAVGTLIESGAGWKSLLRKDGADAAQVQSAKDKAPGNPMIHFRGEPRRLATHPSTTELESVLDR